MCTDTPGSWVANSNCQTLFRRMWCYSFSGTSGKHGTPSSSTSKLLATLISFVDWSRTWRCMGAAIRNSGLTLIGGNPISSPVYGLSSFSPLGWDRCNLHLVCRMLYVLVLSVLEQWNFGRLFEKKWKLYVRVTFMAAGSYVYREVCIPFVCTGCES